MEKKHSAISFHNLKRHLISDIRGNLPGVLLCALFLCAMVTLTGKVCPVRLLFGIPCPGCGLTRASLLLLRGDWHGSLQCNPFLLPLMAGVLLFLFEHYILERKARFFSLYMIACIILMVAVYVIRMKYWFPDRPPMVYEPDNLLRLLMGLKQK